MGIHGEESAKKRCKKGLRARANCRDQARLLFRRKTWPMNAMAAQSSRVSNDPVPKRRKDKATPKVGYCGLVFLSFVLTNI